MFKKPKNKLWLNIILGAGFLITFLTGDELAESVMLGAVSPHELIAALFGGLAFMHILIHWQWITKVSQRFFSRLPRQTKINYLLNVLLLLAVGLTGFSGLLMSKTLGYNTSESFISEIHETASAVSMLIVGSHLLLHWKWIFNAVKRYLLPAPIRSIFEKKSSRPFPYARLNANNNHQYLQKEHNS
jgi:hypothetical protein